MVIGLLLSSSLDVLHGLKTNMCSASFGMFCQDSWCCTGLKVGSAS